MIKPLFSKEEMTYRKNKLKEKTKHIDVCIIFNRPDLFYYSGTGLDGIIIYDGQYTRYVRRNVELARETSSMPVKIMESFRLFKDLAEKNSYLSVGLELDILPHKTVKYIQKAFDAKIIDISGITREIRSIKSGSELDLMRKAADQTDRSFEFIQDKIKPGITEIELSAEIERFLRVEGHPGMVNIRTFHHNYVTNAYVMAGESTASLNTHFGPVSGTGSTIIHQGGPSRRKIREGDAVLIDTTGVYEGYTGDETITFFVGKVDQKMLDTYDVAKEIHELAEKLLIHGKKASDTYHELIAFVTERGLEQNFMGRGEDRVQFIGHGIGLELDELPVITPGYIQELKENQVIALEPKFIFDTWGVGLEQDYIIGKSKAERITRFQY
ncbi:MAG: aminopeptidase P family protein [Candidatus Heimdallarchaeota archaeon]|nr:aminopeptidase P family protein [Candidatus Heimdallarchaeota archaeon]